MPLLTALHPIVGDVLQICRASGALRGFGNEGIHCPFPKCAPDDNSHRAPTLPEAEGNPPEGLNHAGSEALEPTRTVGLGLSSALAECWRLERSQFVLQNCHVSRRRYTCRVKADVSVLVAGVLLVIGFAGCDSKPAQVERPAADSPAVSNASASVVVTTNEFAVLQGRWQRGDGDYLIEIQNVDVEGKLVARYFNPRPINVSQAQASRKDDRLQVFVELRDVNYPGSTYRLTYDAKHDQLFGQYFQATMRETFDVAFGRVK